MATARPFAYNTGSTISGTEQVGDLAIGFPTNGFASTGLKWWNGPDEDLGYVIAHPTPSGQPGADGTTANLGFWRSSSLTDVSFISLAETIGGQTFTGATDAKTWLNDNGYWTSWTEPEIIRDNLFVELEASDYTSGTWNDRTANNNDATINGATWSSTDGGIFDFNGTSNSISIPHKTELSLSQTIQKTIQVWVKFDTLPNSNVQMPVFGKLSSSFAFDGYWAGVFSNGGVVRSVTNGTSIQRTSDSTLTISANTWYLYTFISQITATANTTKVYINNTEYISTAHGSDGYSESNDLYLGRIGLGVGGYLDGKIGACYFYTKGLNVDEITNNFDVTKSRYGY